MKGFALLSLLSLLALPKNTYAISSKKCDSLLASPLAASARWSPSQLEKMRKFQLSDFLPETYLTELRAVGFDPKLKLSFHRSAKHGHLSISVEPKNKSEVFTEFEIADLKFWAGRDEKSVVVEELLLQNPIAGRTNLHPSQMRKGLPGAVAMFFKKGLYAFLANAGFTNLEVATSQNYLVGTLYRRMLGGTQAAEGKAFSDYLTRLYKLSSESFPDHLRISDIDKFSAAMGNAFRSPLSLKKHIPDFDETQPFAIDEAFKEKLKSHRGLLLEDPTSGVPVAIGFDKTLVFLYQEPPGYLPIYWKDIHARHPDWVRIDVTLPPPQ